MSERQKRRSQPTRATSPGIAPSTGNASLLVVSSTMSLRRQICAVAIASGWRLWVASV